MSIDDNANKPKRPFGRSLGHFENLSEAEKKLIACAWRGEVCQLGESVPEKPTLDNVIRPELIRFLALGGDEEAPVHAKGVQLRGAWIGSAEPGKNSLALDFDGARMATRLGLVNCYFTTNVKFIDCCANSLLLDGCVFPGISADRLRLDGSFLLRRVYSKGTVSLGSAVIGGDLDCSGSCFENKDGDALYFDCARIGGDVFLSQFFHEITNMRCLFHAVGGVRLFGVTIGGNLDCRGGYFENDGGQALDCDGANIGLALLFREGTSAKGLISFAHAKVGTLADDINCWPDKSLDLDGFRYERITASSPLEAKSRIAWLDKQWPELLPGDSFALQPWIHLAKVLREQGHFREASEVDIAREERLRAAGKVAGSFTLLKRIHQWIIPFLSMISRISKPFISAGRIANDLITYFFHWVYGWFSGYGHRPLRIIYFAAAIWFVFAFAYNQEATNGHFAPAIAITDKSLGMKCVIEQGKEPVNWTRCNELLVNYPRFNAWAYSLDLILPVVQLGEFTRWNHVWQGNWLSFSGFIQILIYFEKIFGWVAALTLAAIAAGLVKRKEG